MPIHDCTRCSVQRVSRTMWSRRASAAIVVVARRVPMASAWVSLLPLRRLSSTPVSGSSTSTAWIASAERLRQEGNKAMAQDRSVDGKKLMYDSLREFLLRNHPTASDLMFELSMAHLQDGEVEQSESLIKHREAFLIQLGDWRRLLGAKLEHGRQLELMEGVDTSPLLRKVYQEAVDLCETHSMRNEDSVRARVSLGRSMLDSGETRAARTHLDRALAELTALLASGELPSADPDIAELHADCHLSLGGLFASEDRHGVAEKHLREGSRVLEQVYGNDGAALMSKGLLCCTLAANGKTAEAVKIAMMLLEVTRNGAAGPYGYLTYAGIALQRSGRAAMAKEALAMSLQYNANDPSEIEFAQSLVDADASGMGANAYAASIRRP